MKMRWCQRSYRGGSLSFRDIPELIAHIPFVRQVLAGGGCNVMLTLAGQSVVMYWDLNAKGAFSTGI